MKILEPGNGYIVEVRCTGRGNGGKGCEALLGADRNDLRYYEGVPGGSWRSRDPEVCVRCPQCGTVTDLPEKDWPGNYRNLKRYSKHWRETGNDEP